MLLKNINLY